MKVLQEYKAQYGQKINKDKSFFYMSNKATNASMKVVEDAIGFLRGKFPLMYLRCPIGRAKKMKVDFTDLNRKIQNKLHRALVKYVLQSKPICLLSVLVSPKYIIYDIHRIFAKFLWNFIKEGRAKHWISQDDICVPKEERGLGFWSLFDFSKALSTKLWLSFKTKILCGPISYGIIIARGMDHRLWNG
ncbi:hypothetical protein H5410_021194 [Solanum commersonii]|uniref:Reverse transcriptase n=1 Tax=Solanum commersonii TaxID=4109 RepID=A0A9J5ZAM1_SOLCO|nr:hypothetical protein H5410_021194 [Solanum commersonii]